MKTLSLYLFLLCNGMLFAQGICISDVLESANNFRWRQEPIEVPLDSNLQIGKIYQIPELLFVLAGSEILLQTGDSIKKIAMLIRKNTDKVFEIAAHTDARGNPDQNLVLSKERAKKVYDHLVNTFGIKPENLMYKGYGQSQLLYRYSHKKKHEVEPYRKSNKRVELRVIKRKDFIDKEKFNKDFKTYYSGEIKSIREVKSELPVVMRIPEIIFSLSPYGLYDDRGRDSLKITAKFIKEHPEYYFQVTAHTDTRGKAAANYTLSIARAKSIYDYLVEKEKVDSCQMTYTGYGPKYFLVSDEEIKKAITRQEKEALHQKNRRTELIVLGKRN